MSRLTLVGLALGSMLFACSSDDDKKPSGGGEAGAAGSALAGRGGSSGSKAGAGGAAANNGTQEEAQLCNTNADCVSGLTCVNFGSLQDDTGRTAKINVCARHCTESMPCKADEECHTESGKPEDAACVSAKAEILTECNVVHDCADNLTCILTSLDQNTGELTGTCVQPCMLAKPDCPTDLSCVDSLKDGTTGICSKTANRGEKCDVGLECKMGDLCIDDGTQALCYQDCTMSGMCDDNKTCVPLQGDDSKICDTP